MLLNDPQTEPSPSPPGEQSGAIHWSESLLDEVRRSAVDGLTRFAHGGLEIGGILYGRREGGVLHISARKEIGCEHSLGPGFVLSKQDQEELAALLAASDAGPADLIPVGWYLSHTRSGLELRAQDQAIFDRFFPEAWQVTLVVKPSAWGPAEARCIARGQARTGDDFTIQPPARVLRKGGPERPENGLELPAAGLATPAAGAGRAGPHRRWRLLAAGIVVAAVAVALMFWLILPPSPPRTAPAGIKLSAWGAARQLRIEWDRTSPPVASATGGELEIIDGYVRSLIALDREQLRSGSITYERRSGSVLVRLRLDRVNQPALEEVTRFIGQPLPAAPQINSAALPVGPPPPAPATTAAAPAPDLPASLPEPQPVPAEDDPPPVRKPARPWSGPVAHVVRPPSATLPVPPVVASSPVPAGVAPPVAPGHAIPAPRPHPQEGLRAGRLIWTGILDRRGVLEIDGGLVSAGSLTGALPGVPLKLHVYPAELAAGGLVVFTADRARAQGPAEEPGRQNGWNETRFTWAPDRARQLAVIEPPNPANSYTRLVLRNDGRPCTVIVIEWARQ